MIATSGEILLEGDAGEHRGLIAYNGLPSGSGFGA